MTLRTERGAMLIQVAISCAVLLALTAFVTDQGIVIVARHQAQNAADAGALSGAVSMMLQPDNEAGAVTAAQAVAALNKVWNEAPAPEHVQVSTPLPAPCPESAGGGNACLRVDVIRGTTDRAGSLHANYLPVFFSRLIGIEHQGIRATAMAQVTKGDAVRCIKPWIVADKWVDNDSTFHPAGGWNQNDVFNPATDTYSSPGFKEPGDLGLELILKEGAIGEWSAGWTQQIDFGEMGSNAYRDAIEGCPDFVPVVGIYDGSVACDERTDANPEKGCVSVKTGMAQGPTSQGVSTLVNADTSASWNPLTNSVTGGCMSDGSCGISPRIVPIAAFDTTAYYTQAAGCSGTGCVARVSNLLGFFVEGMCSDVYPVAASRPTYCGTNAEAQKVVVGRLMHYPGVILGAGGGAADDSFVTAVRLVR